jgi:hypothetical protein
VRKGVRNGGEKRRVGMAGRRSGGAVRESGGRGCVDRRHGSNGRPVVEAGCAIGEGSGKGPVNTEASSLHVHGLHHCMGHGHHCGSRETNVQVCTCIFTALCQL